jgi:hypothetical protein
MTLSKIYLLGLLLVALGVTGVSFAGWTESRTADEPKAMKEIMEKAMKGGLAKKVASGEADDKEKLELLDMLIDMVTHDPPKGDEIQWKMMAGTVMMDAAKVVVGREGAGEALAKSMNCKACHDLFKP